MAVLLPKFIWTPRVACQIILEDILIGCSHLVDGQRLYISALVGLSGSPQYGYLAAKYIRNWVVYVRGLQRVTVGKSRYLRVLLMAIGHTTIDRRWILRLKPIILPSILRNLRILHLLFATLALDLHVWRINIYGRYLRFILVVFNELELVAEEAESLNFLVLPTVWRWNWTIVAFSRRLFCFKTLD